MSVGYNVLSYNLVNVDNVAYESQNIAQLNALIALIISRGSSQGGVTIYFPKGVYNFNIAPSLLTGSVDTNYPFPIRIVGAGIGQTIIKYRGLADMPSDRGFFHFGSYTPGHYPGQVNDSGVEKLTMVATENTYRKTAIRMEAASHGCHVKEVAIIGTTSEVWHGKDSLGLDLRGHEQVSIERCYLAAVNRIGRNPIQYPGWPQGWLSADHFNFHSNSFIPGAYATRPSAVGGTLPHASLIFEDGSDLQNFSFTGRNAMVGGQYGIYINWSIDLDSYSNSLTVDNLRVEGLHSGDEAASIYIENTSPNPLRELVVRNCELTNGSAENQLRGGQAVGVRTKGVNRILIEGGIHAQSANRILEVVPTGIDDTECLEVELRGPWLNSSLLNNAVALPSNMRRVSSVSRPGWGSDRDHVETHAIWRRISEYPYAPAPQMAIGEVDVDTQVYELADQTQTYLPYNADYRRTRHCLITVTVSGTRPWSTLWGKAEYLLAPTDMAGAYGGVRLLSTVGNAVAESVPVGQQPSTGAFAMFAEDSRLTAHMGIRSHLGEPALFVIKAEMIQGRRLIERGVHFNGTTQYIYSNGGATIQNDGVSLVNSGEFILFVKYRPTDLAGAKRLIEAVASGAQDGISLNLASTSRNPILTMYPASGGTVVKSVGGNQGYNAWKTILISCSRSKDLFQCYVDDVQQISEATGLAGDIRFSNIDLWYIARGVAGNYFTGDMAALFLATGISYDLSKEYNRRLFHGPASDELRIADMGMYGKSVVPNPFLLFGGQVSANRPYHQGWSFDSTDGGGGGPIWTARNRGNFTDWLVGAGPLTDVTS